MAMSSLSGIARSSSAKRRLKDVSEKPEIPSAAAMLERKTAELEELRVRELDWTARQIEAEKENSARPDPTPGVEKMKCRHRSEKLQGEISLLREQARDEHAIDPATLEEADRLVRERALLVIAIRKTSAAIDELVKKGAVVPAYSFDGISTYGDVLLGTSQRVGRTGKIARGYVAAAYNAGLITAGELAEDN